MTNDLQGRLEHLEARLRAMEDRDEITRLLLMHPPSVDSGEAEFWMANWTEDSVMDRPPDPTQHSGDYSGVYGKAAMLAEIKSPELAASRASGLMHMSTNPTVVVDGDRATATSYTQLVGLRLDPFGYDIRFAIVNRWELVRDAGRWRIRKRVIRALGQPEAVELLRDGLDRGWAHEARG